MYTMEDHQADAVRFPACSLGHVWKQRGNKTGHCAKCHATFEGIDLFDRHQSSVDGVTVCADPAGMTIRGVPLELFDGAWRGPRMSDAEKERFSQLR